MNYKNIMIAGCGVLGSQIAFQTAYKGFHVFVYDINDEAIERAKDRISNLKPYYKEDLWVTEEDLNTAYARISFSSDLSTAFAEADFVIEAIPEVVQIKTDFYTELGKLPPEKTIFATNSSTLLPSQFAKPDFLQE
ncbi:putative 3-hydroxybutyryl-CoA dehydrogenase [Peribacillus sp. Bi96]|nr:putative 3-hydroxybutyryl-CoA dehydrogenase [Peribacillus sp. Bi96]